MWNSLVSVSQVAEITGVHHCAQFSIKFLIAGQYGVLDIGEKFSIRITQGTG